MRQVFNREGWARRGPLSRALLVVASAAALSGCLLHPLRHHEVATAVNPGEQPDKILYDRAIAEIAKGRYDVGRLTLQTLINTYPDSEYLAKAKLATANSYYQQGGVSGLTQAEAEYKDFKTFFPTAPEAPMAQYRVAMAHYRLIGKADRDLTEARAAEVELKEFLREYPDSPLMPQVKGRLRAVQEVLAQGEFDTARYYLSRGAKPAALSRLQEITDKYPSFSRADEALWELADLYRGTKLPKLSAPYYDRLIMEYPLSEYVPEAKKELADLHEPIPTPTKAAMARAQADRADRESRSLLAQFGGMFSSAPDISSTRHGPVIPGPAVQTAVEAAKTPAPAAAGGNSVAVQPVGDASLKAGTPVDPKAEAKPASENKDSQTAKPGDNQEPAKDSKETKKKKGKLHIIKKLFPF